MSRDNAHLEYQTNIYRTIVDRTRGYGSFSRLEY